MIELKGKRNTAIIFADKIDKPTKTQIAALLRGEAYADSKIRFMPDVHSGRWAAVGTTLTVSGRIAPALLGVDIGCGVEVIFLKETEADLARLDAVIHDQIPCGARIRETPVASFSLEDLRCREYVDVARAQRSLGTLGGGNHFIELDRRADGTLVLMIHSGSRALGAEVAAWYQEQALRYCRKKEGRKSRQRQREVREDGYASCKALRREEKNAGGVKREDAILEGELLQAYLCDIAVTAAFADCNRRTMADLICEAMGFTVTDRFSCVHNYIDTEHGILRKGAISARQGERVIIPLNMRDGALLGTGLGNPDWNFSAPHGAGRICSRTDARYTFTLEEYRRQMEGIYTTTAQMGSLDECPMAYKPADTVLALVKDTVRADEIIKPIYNFKSC